jgi:hypothetical protein
MRLWFSIGNKVNKCSSTIYLLAMRIARSAAELQRLKNKMFLSESSFSFLNNYGKTMGNAVMGMFNYLLIIRARVVDRFELIFNFSFPGADVIVDYDW